MSATPNRSQARELARRESDGLAVRLVVAWTGHRLLVWSSADGAELTPAPERSTR